MPIFGKKIAVSKEIAEPRIENVRIFKPFFSELAETDPQFKTVSQAVGLCTLALRVIRGKINVADKIRLLDERLSQLSHFKEMTALELIHFKSLLDRFASLTNERKTLLDQLTTFDKSLENMGNLESDALDAVDEIKDAERYQRALRHDIGFLEGEKENLKYERNSLVHGINFVGKFSFVLVSLFVFASIFLSYLSLSRGQDIFFYVAALILLAVLTASIVFIFRRNVAVELSRNGKKQQKAVHVLNQKNVVFAYYTNFLSFVYGKYHVKNSGMLQSNLENYDRYKQVLSRIDSIRPAMYETQNEIEKIMRDNNINNMRSSLESFARSVDLDDQKKIYEDLSAQKSNAERTLDELDKKHEAVWDLMTRLRLERPEYSEILDDISETYMDEMGRLLSTMPMQAS
ncbi:MAG: hypothetical protein LBQ68_10005 [Clostridiales bacterium]|jgi:hypothetical protein|nr:hypothetical protein [Clostridiales bacterium]